MHSDIKIQTEKLEIKSIFHSLSNYLYISINRRDMISVYCWAFLAPFLAG